LRTSIWVRFLPSHPHIRLLRFVRSAVGSLDADESAAAIEVDRGAVHFEDPELQSRVGLFGEVQELSAEAAALELRAT